MLVSLRDANVLHMYALVCLHLFTVCSVSISVQRVTVRGAHVCVAPTRVSVLFFVVNDCIFVLLLPRLRVCDQVILMRFLELGTIICLVVFLKCAV